MSDLIEAKKNDSQTHDTTKKYQDVLANHGYATLETSVHGKNQTRFLHFILSKNGQKYFSKANLPDQYETHVNSSLVSKLADSPPKDVRFLAPAEIIEAGDVIFHIYPYIDQKPVSNESAGFTDFAVDTTDTDLFLKRVIDAIDHVASQQFVTANEHRKAVSVNDTVVSLLKKLPSDTPYAMEFLKYLLVQPGLREFQLAVTDIQPQNMFWLEKDKQLIVFDLDAVGPQLRYFDYAKFFSQLWVVYDKADFAIRFLELYLATLEPREKGEAYRYIRFNLTLETLVDYTVFKDPDSQERIVALMRWIRKDLLEMMNPLADPHTYHPS